MDRNIGLHSPQRFRGGQEEVTWAMCLQRSEQSEGSLKPLSGSPLLSLMVTCGLAGRQGRGSCWLAGVAGGMLCPSSQELLGTVHPTIISSPLRAQGHGDKSEEVNAPQKGCPMLWGGPPSVPWRLSLHSSGSGVHVLDAGPGREWAGMPARGVLGLWTLPTGILCPGIAGAGV